MSDTSFELPESSPRRGAKAKAAPASLAIPSTTNQDQPSADTQPSKTQDYSQEELLKIFDEIIFSGEYVETFSLRKGQLQVTFRTRTVEEYGEIQSEIDGAKLNLVSSVEHLRSSLMLQYALTQYHTKNLASMKPAEKKAFVDKLPGPVVGLLLNLLSEFDRKVQMACQEGEQNF